MRVIPCCEINTVSNIFSLNFCQGRNATKSLSYEKNKSKYLKNNDNSFRYSVITFAILFNKHLLTHL